MFSGIDNKLIDNKNFSENSVDQKLEKADSNSFDSLPTEVALEIFSYLDLATLGKIGFVNKKWKQLAEDFLLPKKVDVYKNIAFSNDKWAHYFGKDAVKNEDRNEEFDSLPWNIAGILESPCPVHPNMKIKDTHILVRLPKTLKGRLTVESLGELAKNYFKNTELGYAFICPNFLRQYGYQSIDKSRWILMTNKNVPQSTDKNYAEQQEIIRELAQKNIGYEVPETLEAVACIFAHYFRSNIRLFNSEEWIYTRCKENVDGHRMVVGVFGSDGLNVDFSDLDKDKSIGVAAVRKFF